MKLVIGLTGGTGAGKSAVSAYLSQKGAIIIDADRLSRKITEPGMPALIEIADCFPGTVKNGELDRRALGKIVFSDKSALTLLNRITHKYIRNLTEQLIQSMSGIIILDAPLLYEAGEDVLCNKVIFVTANDDIRLKRIMERDGLSRLEAKARIEVRNLAPLIRRADYVIENNSGLDALKRQVDYVMEKIKSEKTI